MKHSFLRRLSALALALAMAASLCAIPVLADPGNGTTDPGSSPDPGGSPSPTTPAAPDPNAFKLGPELIILPGPDSTGSNTTCTVTASGVPEGCFIVWTASTGVSVNGKSSDTTQVLAGETTSTVEVTATAAAAPGTISAQAYANENGAQAPNPYTATLRCYVYGGGNSPLVIPPTLPELTVGQAKTFTLSYNTTASQAVKDIFDRDGGVTFQSIPASSADTTVARSANGFTVTIDPKQKGTPSFLLTLPGGFTKRWDNVEISPAPGTIPVNSVTITPDYLDMTAKDTHAALAATVSPQNATNKTVTWYSENPSIVQVNETSGQITAVAAGRTAIYALADGVRSNSCIVAVSAAPNSVTLDNTALTLDLTQGVETKQLKATADPAQGTTFAWRINGSTAVVDFNTATTATGDTVTVRGKKEGTATIVVTATFTDANNRKTTKTAQCTVTVLDSNSKPVNQITLSESSHTMPADGSFNLSVTSFNPSNVLNKAITWTCSDSTIAEVEKVNQTTVKVKGKKAGTVRITATADFGGANKICEVTVTPAAETITLGGFTYESNPVGTNNYTYTFRSTTNDYISVRAILGPTGANDPIHWSSKNESIATVSKTTGTQASVTAVGAGKTVIYAVPMDPNGKDRVLESGPAQIEVTVSGIGLDRTSLTLMQGRRETLAATAFGSAYNGNNSVEWTSSDPSVVSVGTKTGESTALTARSPGSAIITATKGSYRATCQVTVTEDTAGVIDGISTTPGTAYQFSNLASRLQSACSAKTGASLSYITNLSVSSTEQGILHDQHHSSSDTGAGVGIQDRYYPGTAPQGQRSLSDLSFVPKNTFSGVAEINYTAWSTNNQSVSGVIRINVNGTGDVMYSSGDGSPVTFSADDFNFYHPNLRSVSFTLPLESRGILYYGYTSASQPGTKVTASDTYNRTGTPSLDRVTFVPASGYTGTVAISYRGTDTSGRAITGTVTINVGSEGQSSPPGDIYYPMTEDGWTTFKPADFSAASRAVLGETLSYVRFTLPPSNEGTLFYNYRGFGNYDSDVASTTSYYYSGTPSLAGISFVPTTTTPSQVDIHYTGYTTRGNTFTGTIHIGMEDPNQQSGLRYTVSTGKSVYFSASDFNTACVAATGASLDYVLFSPLPAVGQGTLRYTRGNSSTIYTLSTATRCYRTSSNTWDTQLNNVSFLASSTFTGNVSIPFTGYNTNGTTFTGEVSITVTPPTTGDSVYSGTTASPIRLSSSRMRSLCSGVLDRELSYITFTSLPSSTAGRLYLGYSSFSSSGSQVNTGTRYYVSSSPSIDQISFVPRGRYNGQVSVGYTATDTSGKSVSGLLTFNITSTGNSTYFNDMGGHTWAGPAVDYLRQNSVTNGVTATAFGPDQHILRCDFVLMLCRAFNFTGGSGYSFADVPANAYYASAVATAKQLGIVNGDGVNFMPNSELTRQDAMVIIKNALDVAGWNVDSASTSILGRFPDGVSVSSYARTAVSTLINMGAVTGDNGMLYPFNPITRAEAAVILHFVMTM